jgi:hypothetical protein
MDALEHGAVHGGQAEALQLGSMAVKIQVDPVVPGHATCDDDHAAVADRQPASFALGGRERLRGRGQRRVWTHMVHTTTPPISNSVIYKTTRSLFTVFKSSPVPSQGQTCFRGAKKTPPPFFLLGGGGGWYMRVP